MLLYTAPTPCTFDGSTTDAQSCYTCSCLHFVGSCSHAAQLHKQSCAKLSRYSTRPSFARLWLFEVLVLETFALGTLRLECDSVLPLCSDTILFHWIIQSRSGRRTTARVFALHFEASHSQHCPREAAVFGFWEEPARVLLCCAFKMSSSSDSHFAIKRSWSNSAGSKTLHALEEGGGSQSGLQIGSHGVRAQVASIGDPLPRSHRCSHKRVGT